MSTLWVGLGGLPKSVTDRDVHAAFSRFGEIRKRNVTLYYPGVSGRSYAKVEFEHEWESQVYGGFHCQSVRVERIMRG